MISLGSLRSPGSGRVGQLLRQIQFDIQSCQICDAKFQCLHISQRYLRSNRCETTLIKLIKLSVCPKHTSPHSSPEREENPCPAMPCCAIYQPPPSPPCRNLITFAIQQAPPAVGVFIVDTFPSCALQHEYERRESASMRHAACGMQHEAYSTVHSTQHNNRCVYVKIQNLNASPCHTRSIKWHLVA